MIAQEVQKGGPQIDLRRNRLAVDCKVHGYLVGSAQHFELHLED
jgi:hypothetical protein